MQLFNWHILARRLSVVVAMLVGGCNQSADSSAETLAAARPGPCEWVDPTPEAPRDPTDLWSGYRHLSTVIAAHDALIAVGFSDASHPAADRMASALMLVSCDGETWRPSDLPEHSGRLYTAAYGNDTLVVTGAMEPSDTGALTFIRRRGEAWQTFENSEQLGELIFGNGVFLSYGASPAVRVSTDGVQWESTTLGAASGFVGRIVFDGDRFIAYHDSTFQTSRDGRVWSEPSAPQEYTTCNAFHALQDQMVGFCMTRKPPSGPWDDVPSYRVYQLVGPRMSQPSDWSAVEVAPAMRYATSHLASNENVLVGLFVGPLPSVMQLPVGSAAWETQAPSETTASLQLVSLTRNAGRFVAVGNQIVSSEDGRGWRIQRIP